jgi:hypothetical protein
MRLETPLRRRLRAAAAAAVVEYKRNYAAINMVGSSYADYG